MNVILPIVASWWFSVANIVDETAPPPVQWRVEPAATAISPGGSIDLVCSLDIPAGWHVYWSDPGASGAPTNFEFESLPPGVVVEPVRFQRPSVFPTKVGRVFGFEDQLVAAARVHVPDTATVGSAIQLSVLGDWLLCQKACYIGGGEKTVTIHIGQEGVPTDAASLVKSIPSPVRSRPGTTASWDQDASQVVITGPMSSKGPPRAFIDRVAGVEVGHASVDVADGAFHLSLPVRLMPGDSMGEPAHVRGLLIFGSSRYDPAWSFDIACDADDSNP